MIDQLKENTLWMNHSPMLYVLGVFKNASSEVVDRDTDHVYNSQSRKISPQPLGSAVIGQHNDVMLVIS